MVHDLDVLNWLFGIPKTVYARGQKGSAGGWDHAHVVPDYGEVSAWAEGSVMMPAGYPFTTALEVLCEDGSVEFRHRADQEKGNARAVLGTGLTVYRPNEIPQELPVQNADPYEREIAYFIECVKGKKLPEKGTANQGRLAVRIALAARQSLETGQAVTL
jgi:predicted dehydrogenase